VVIGSTISWHAEGASGGAAAEVSALGLGSRMPACFVDRPKGTAGYLLVHFHDPTRILLHGEMRDHPAHTFVIWPPDAPHHFGSARRWNHSWVLCGGRGVGMAIEASGLRLQQPIAQPGAEAAERYLRLIHGEVSRWRAPDPLLIESFLSLWLREAARDASDGSPDHGRVPPRMLVVRQAIEADPAQAFALAQLARLANLSISRFSQEFRRCFGASPIAYVLKLRLKRARFLLADRNLSIKQVARRCGFSDPRYFARQFRAHFGEPPSGFR
jgi:AraC-like DNA-binding protein